MTTTNKETVLTGPGPLIVEPRPRLHPGSTRGPDRFEGATHVLLQLLALLLGVLDLGVVGRE